MRLAQTKSNFSILSATLRVRCFSCLIVAVTGLVAGANPHTYQDNSIAIEALSRLKGIDLENNPAVRAAVLKILEQARGTPQFVQIVRDFKIKGQGKGLLEFVSNHPEDQTAVDATRLILDEGDVQLLKDALSTTNAASFVKALSNIQDKEIVPLLLPIVTDTAHEITLRRQAVHGLAQIQEGAATLLALAKTQKLPEDLRMAAGWELNSVHWPEIKSQANQVLPLPQGKDAEPLPPISELAHLKGDPSKGAEVFRREAVGCIKCHQVKGDGTDFGPNLSEIGAKLGKDALYEAILDPSAGISFGYEAWQLELKNGESAYGLLVSETADEIVIRAIGGVTTRYRKEDILKRDKQKLSIMPSGLQQAMTRQELVDLIEYLASLKP